MTCRLCDDNGFTNSPIARRPERCPCMAGKPVHILVVEPGHAHAPRGLHCVVCDPLQTKNGATGLHVGTFVMASRIAWLPNGNYTHWDPAKRGTDPKKPTPPQQVAVCLECVNGIAACMLALQAGTPTGVAHGVAHLNTDGAAPKSSIIL